MIRSYKTILLCLFTHISLIAETFKVTNNTPFTIDFNYESISLLGTNQHSLKNIAPRSTTGHNNIELKKMYQVTQHKTQKWNDDSRSYDVDMPVVVIDQEFSFGHYPAGSRHVTVNYDPAAQKFSYTDKRQ